jgi:hypothetical protein
MTERTGIPELDTAIEQFLANGFEDEGGIGVAHGWLSKDAWNDGARIPFERFRDPAAADGLCHALNGQAARFLADHGFDAYSSEDDLPHGLDYDPAVRHSARSLHPDQLGYGDRTIEGADHHVVCFVELSDGSVLALDFACAQYGYTATLPLVLRYDGKGRFSRCQV